MNKSNKVAIVTGGSSGIGAAVVTRLAKEGFHVFFSYNSSKEGAEETLSAVKRVNGECAFHPLEIRDVSQTKAFFKAAVLKYGTPDVVVLNAGQGILKPIAESTEEDFDQIFGINARGTFFCLKETALCINDNGSVLLVSSSTTAFAAEGAAIYAGSKATIKVFTEIAARELGKKGVNVNAIMPGVTLTRMADKLPQTFKDSVAVTSPFHRLGESYDVANVIYALVSSDNKWVTGQIILANGGGTH